MTGTGEYITMKYYISTPINGRTQERTFIEKYHAAEQRCREIKNLLIRQDPTLLDSGEIVTPFDVTIPTMDEPHALGACITALMQCDTVVLDHGFQQSRGCRLEQQAAVLYGKIIMLL